MTQIDQVARYLRWFKDCPLNRTEKFFDIGITDRNVLLRFKTSLEFCCGQLRPQNAGNDSIMSRAPVPLFHVFHAKIPWRPSRDQRESRNDERRRSGHQRREPESPRWNSASSLHEHLMVVGVGN